MRTFKIPVTWQSCGIIEIEANTLKEALKIFDEEEDTYSLPEGEYVDGSFERDLEDSCEEYNKWFELKE